MSKFDPNKLTVTFKNGVTATTPIIPRCYTLTHSDITAQLFLDIGLTFSYDKITPIRDEVLGQWIVNNGTYAYFVSLQVDGDSEIQTKIRNEIFIRELPLALESIRYGDGDFFNAYPYLDTVPILVKFNSTNNKFNRLEDWGTFSQYNISTTSRSITPSSYIIISHASPNLPSIDVYSNDSLIAKNISYRESACSTPINVNNLKLCIYFSDQVNATIYTSTIYAFPNTQTNLYVVGTLKNLAVYNIPQLVY